MFNPQHSDAEFFVASDSDISCLFAVRTIVSYSGTMSLTDKCIGSGYT